MRRGYAQKRDNSEPDIVDALEKAGVLVWRKLPVDLLYFYRGKFGLLEIKTPKGKKGQVWADKRQEEQAALCKALGISKPTTPEEALQAVGALRIVDFEVKPIYG